MVIPSLIRLAAAALRLGVSRFNRPNYAVSTLARHPSTFVDGGSIDLITFAPEPCRILRRPWDVRELRSCRQAIRVRVVFHSFDVSDIGKQIIENGQGLGKRWNDKICLRTLAIRSG